MVHVAGFPAFQDNGDRRALLGPDQILLDCGHRQERGDRYVVFIHPAVRQDDDIGAVLISFVHLDEQPVQRPFDRCVFII